MDRNYWSDYLTKYPNAKEIGNSGIWDTPYNYGGSLGDFTDNHPLIEPVSVIPEFPIIGNSATIHGSNITDICYC